MLHTQRPSLGMCIPTHITNHSTNSRRAHKTIVRATSDSQQAPPTRIGNPSPLPASTKEQVDQAFNSIKSAWESGINRQQVTLSLPLIGATDLDDWPGGIRQQFKAITPMMESLLKQLKALPGLEGPLSARIVDSADAVGEWKGDKLATIVFPTAETIRDVKNLAEGNKNGLTLIVNPQWTPSEGQVISDFGILPWQRKAAEDLLDSFTDTYALTQLRINGDNVRWLLNHPNGWQVNVLTGPGQDECILQSYTKPTYKEVEAKLRSLPWTMSSKGLMDRIMAEAEFNRRSSEGPPPPQR